MDIVYKWICLLSWIWFSKPDIGFKLGYMINRLFQVFSTWGFWSRKTPKKWGLHQQQKTVSYATENPNVNGNIFHGLIIFNRYTWKKSLKWIWGMHSRNHHHARGFCTVKKPNPDRPIVVKIAELCPWPWHFTSTHIYIEPGVALCHPHDSDNLTWSVHKYQYMRSTYRYMCMYSRYIYIIHMCMCIYIHVHVHVHVHTYIRLSKLISKHT